MLDGDGRLVVCLFLAVTRYTGSSPRALERQTQGWSSGTPGKARAEAGLRLPSQLASGNPWRVPGSGACPCGKALSPALGSWERSRLRFLVRNMGHMMSAGLARTCPPWRRLEGPGGQRVSLTGDRALLCPRMHAPPRPETRS